MKMLEPAEGLTDPDEVTEPPKVPKTKPGDLWVMGDHRLLCGDATRLGDLESETARRRTKRDRETPAVRARERTLKSIGREFESPRAYHFLNLELT